MRDGMFVLCFILFIYFTFFLFGFPIWLALARSWRARLRVTPSSGLRSCRMKWLIRFDFYQSTSTSRFLLLHRHRLVCDVFASTCSTTNRVTVTRFSVVQVVVFVFIGICTNKYETGGASSWNAGHKRGPAVGSTRRRRKRREISISLLIYRCAWLTERLLTLALELLLLSLLLRWIVVRLTSNSSRRDIIITEIMKATGKCVNNISRILSLMPLWRDVI